MKLDRIRRLPFRRAGHRAHRRQRGITLVEAGAVLAITSILLGSALPGFRQLRERQHLNGLAAQLETDLHLARSEAVAKNRIVRLSFGGSGNQACYAIHTGNAGDCDCGSGACSSGAELIATRKLEGKLPLAISSNSRSLAFSPTFGTVTPTATMRLSNLLGDEVRLIINITGRVRSCTPTSSLRSFQPAC
ncbi:MAG TPA: GspH/FimT family pseudopilin [Rubrivivax sp.]|nr:GspH/FimT family pseudopilin [Burkholderiales bacterium]HNU11419.1 GspH/FimT family pseudopilin [Rubrivivax sp.]